MQFIPAAVPQSCLSAVSQEIRAILVQTHHVVEQLSAGSMQSSALYALGALLNEITRPWNAKPFVTRAQPLRSELVSQRERQPMTLAGYCRCRLLSLSGRASSTARGGPQSSAYLRSMKVERQAWSLLR